MAASRPPERQDKDVYLPAALLMADNCHLARRGPGPVLSVEVKCKKGFMDAELAAEQLCNFCLKQRYTVRRGGGGGGLSGYCPLELFSGDPRRMAAAAAQLMETPRNNLRVFADGQLTHGEADTHTAACDQVDNCL